ILPFEADVAGPGNWQALAALSFQLLLGANAVDGQLQCARGLWRPAKLVVHDPQGPVIEEVDAIGLAPDPHRLKSGRALEADRPFERILEQPLRHADPLLDLDGKRPAGKSRCGGRSEEVGPFERSIALGEVLQMPFGNLFEQRERFVEISSGDARPAPLAPRLEERLERAVQQLPPLERREAGLVLTFLFQLEDLAGEILERTLQVAPDA